MANPAAVYCEELGYTLDTRQTVAGEDAACIFPDGSECPQWDFLSGRCGQVYSFCAQQGGIITDSGGNVGICSFEDASTCDEYSFLSGDCQPGINFASGGGDPATDAEQNPEQEAGLQVIGWMGYVVSTPAGAQFDDYVIFYPEGEVGEFGIDGATDELKADIVNLRYRQQPGKNAHFWGTLTCDIPDYGGCQVLVERMRVDGPGEFFDPDPVDGWEGTIVSLSYNEPGAPQPDDAFILSGDYPVQYGIDSAVSVESGERDLNAVIASLHGSGKTVRIWGDVSCGVPDAGGCHIEASRIEVEGQVYEITPVQ